MPEDPSESAEFGKNPYVEDGGPVERPSYVLFLDVLGFSNAIRTATSTDARLGLIKSIRAVLDRASDLVADDGAVLYQSPQASFFAKTFSDNIVIGFPVNGDHDDEGLLGSALEAAGSFQLEFLRRGFFTRGAIAFGPYYADRDMAFGIPLLEAVEGEKDADYTRIILLPSVVAKVRGFLESYDGVDGTPEASYIYHDPDGKYYVNYLGIAINDREVTSPEAEYWIDLHRERVLAAQSKFAHDAKIARKFAWARGYHDSFCDLEGVRAELKCPPIHRRITAAML